MDARGALRERGRWTKATIVSMLVQTPGISRSAIARDLGLTVQAVSVQVQELMEAGAVVDEDGLRPTPQGIDALQHDADALRAAAGALGQPLATMDVISAVAARDVTTGATVGLWMRDGDLVADPDDVGPSRGVAQAAAAAGHEVLVQAPQGITEHRPGRVQVVVVPEPRDGGIAAAAKLPRWDGLVAALGTGAGILARQLGRLDIPFAGAEGALDAARRGLDVRLLVSADRLPQAMQVLERAGVPVRIVEARKEGKR